MFGFKKNSPVKFLKESITDIRQTGSVAPSSSHLAKLLITPIESRPNLCIVELGAGTGSVTEPLLKVLPQDAILLVIENNEKMVTHLRERFIDPRVHIVLDDACNIGKNLRLLGKEKADYIISGLPFGNMSKNVRASILKEIQENLTSDGIYTQFQYFLGSILPIRRMFRIEKLNFEWRNLPPAFVYWCKIKKGPA